MWLCVSTFIAASAAIVSSVAALPSGTHSNELRSLTDPTLYIFGDSLSDVGTLKTMTLGLVPPKPYWEGRFSSGPAWNEYLALLLKYNLYNRALGGSTSDNTHSTLIDILNINIPSTQDQINYFKFTRPLYKLDPSRKKDVAVLEVGANDFFAELTNLKSKKLTIDSFVNTLSTTVMSQVDQLHKIGFKNLIVANMAAIQYTPMSNEDSETRQIAQTMVIEYNKLLESAAASWKSSAKDVGFFAIGDIGGFVELTIGSPAIIGALDLNDTKSSCIAGLVTESVGDLLLSIINSADTPTCADPSTKYFFDDIHPAERIHRLFGYYANELVKALFSGSTYDLNEENLLYLISTYKLNTKAPKPASV
ncbi:hypothetical protein IW140_003014 [Coemansia sp. RSA 1813]|nr:hypothetical protein EV178_001233 [Coemansia sp. RSA 1646]KAJ1772586.1 hypothetical protein LPJ74_001302 [Coemansia sp. RSA 1843]KAJ2091441.1 hypothetical protein IW138_001900 [Coemansia sp. RSA 986]KAJ2213894.1 hypothetical protein EV179_003478 [Coemansia sp. RSA 487]KAJ2569606.1 hypothetical protein IW140_003014 [Coemansia sp. RSA 1813]